RSAKGAVGDLSHRPALRRAAPDRRAARQGGRARAAVGARPALGIRRRCRYRRGGLAQRLPAAGRPRIGERRPRGARRLATQRGQPAGAQGRAADRAAPRTAARPRAQHAPRRRNGRRAERDRQCAARPAQGLAPRRGPGAGSARLCDPARPDAGRDRPPAAGWHRGDRRHRRYRREKARALRPGAAGTGRARSLTAQASVGGCPIGGSVRYCTAAPDCLAYAAPKTACRERLMFERFERSWDLAAECWRLLMEDKSLLVFPLLSSLGFAGGKAPHAIASTGYLWLFVFYWIQYSIVIFFNTALVEVAMRRFDDEDAGVADGLRRAAALLPVILVYAFIAATVGTLLRAIAERVGIIGKIVVGLVGVGWTVATALVVPVLAAENVGPIEAIGRSVELIKKSWGENIIGNAGLGLVFGAIMFLLAITGGVLVFAAFGNREWALGIVLAVLLVLAVSLVALARATLQGIYSAALYRFATGDPASGGIDRRLLENAFRTKP